MELILVSVADDAIYEEKINRYKKNLGLLLNDITNYITKNIRNNIHNSEYEIGVLRKSVREALSVKINKDPMLIGDILNYSKDSPKFKGLVKETGAAACLRYRDLMLEKHPHLNKKPAPKHHSRLRVTPK